MNENKKGDDFMPNNAILLSRLEDVYLEPTEATRAVCHTCSLCKEDILEGDPCYPILGEVICESCVENALEYAEVD